MKITIYVFTFAFLMLPYIYCQDTTTTIVKVDFHIPKDWEKINDTTYILKNFGKSLSYWSEALNSGHQPWMSDPKNCAAACLWEFGIKYHSDIFNFARQISEIKIRKVYSYKVNKVSYLVYIRTKDKIPIANKLEIRK